MTIRWMAPEDLDRVAWIWLEGNLSGHPFIPASYWKENAPAVREQLAAAAVLDCQREGEIAGFVGLDGESIAGLFVAPDQQNRGVGTALLRHCQQRYPRLRLTVYEENEGARRLYERLGFRQTASRETPHPGHRELVMEWCAAGR